MRFAAYIYGLACVSLLVSGVTYFPVLFATSAVAEHIPRPYQTALIYLSLFAVASFGLAYFIRGLLAAKRHGIPSTFSGWRYALVVIGFGLFLVSSIPTAFSIFSSPVGGGASGVPLGLGLIFSVLFVLPAMAVSSKNGAPR